MLRLTYPKTHTLDELRPLYEEFKISYPKIFSEWVDIERSPEKLEQDLLREYQVTVFKFLKSKVEWDSNMAVIYAWLDFRILLTREFNIPTGNVEF